MKLWDVRIYNKPERRARKQFMQRFIVMAETAVAAEMKVRVEQAYLPAERVRVAS